MAVDDGVESAHLRHRGTARTAVSRRATPQFPLVTCLAVLVVFTVILFSLAFVVANRRSTKPAA